MPVAIPTRRQISGRRSANSLKKNRFWLNLHDINKVHTLIKADLRPRRGDKNTQIA